MVLLMTSYIWFDYLKKKSVTRGCSLSEKENHKFYMFSKFWSQLEIIKILWFTFFSSWDVNKFFFVYMNVHRNIMFVFSRDGSMSIL